MRYLTYGFLLIWSIFILAACRSATTRSEYSDEYYVPIMLSDDTKGQTRLAFIRTTDGLLIDDRPLDISENNVSGLKWSPDNRRLVYEIQEETRSDIYVVNSNGEGRYRVVRECGSESPQWSPDSNTIVFVSSDDEAICIPSEEVPHFAPFLRVRGQLYVMDLETQGIKRLTDHSRVAACYPDWSSDGLRIVFQIGCAVPGMGGASRLHVINRDGTNESEILDPYSLPSIEVALAGAMQPKWSSDGKYIGFGAELITSKEPVLRIESQLLITTEDGKNVSCGFRPNRTP